MGSHIFGFLGGRLFVIFTVSKRTRMFLLQTESKVVSFNLKKKMGQFMKIESESESWDATDVRVLLLNQPILSHAS